PAVVVERHIPGERLGSSHLEAATALGWDEVARVRGPRLEPRAQGRDRADILRVAGRLPRAVEREAADLQEADGEVRDLHPGIVDVVLDLDRLAEKPQAPDQGVAEHGVAEVSNVRGLVRVDVRVLDDPLARSACRPWSADLPGQGPEEALA